MSISSLVFILESSTRRLLLLDFFDSTDMTELLLAYDGDMSAPLNLI